MAKAFGNFTSMRFEQTPVDEVGQKLVGFGFRCWFLGYATGEIVCWEAGWNYYCKVLGAQAAKKAYAELSCLGRSVRDRAARPIEVYPMGCCGYAPDERLAISLVAAAQADACPAMRACAFALLDHADVEPVTGSAADLAKQLAGAGCALRFPPTNSRIVSLREAHACPHTGTRTLN